MSALPDGRQSSEFFPKKMQGLSYDTIVIGSGFGGSMIAHALVHAGERVLLLERGSWVDRGEHNWETSGAFLLTPHYTRESPYRVRQGLRWEEQGICACVGGPSVFYGGASFRYREDDFRGAAEIVGGSGAAWPVSYAELEPFYACAERLLGVSGEAGVDPTEPHRSTAYPQPPPPPASASLRLAAAARALGLNPFPIPLAINRSEAVGATCRSCTTCDAFACAVEAKNDLATRVLPPLLGMGLQLRPDTVVTRLVAERGSIREVECVDRSTQRTVVFRAGRVVLSAGALASPHLLLGSGLERLNPAGGSIGRYLMRHCNAMTYGVFRDRPNPENKHHKQIAIHDFYFGDGSSGAPPGKLGNIQQVMSPPAGLVQALLPRILGRLTAALIPHLTGLLVIAEDQPRPENRVEIDRRRTDEFGLPQLRVIHRYTRRDRRARRALLRQARRILREAGARATLTWNVTTFSHALGTVRMGHDPQSSPLDEYCRFRGVDNLYVVDGSCLPTSAGVNPSLTIAANALRVGAQLAGS